MRLPLQNVHRALRPWIGTSLFKRCIQPAIYLKINSLLIHTLLFVKQFFFFCRTNPVGRFAQNVIFRIHPVWIAVFFVILRRAKHLLKRDLPLCPTKIPLNGKGSRGISQLTKCVWVHGKALCFKTFWCIIIRYVFPFLYVKCFP